MRLHHGTGSGLVFGSNSEREDLKLVLLSILTIPLTWIFFFGWNLSDCIANHDALAGLYPVLQDFLSHDSDWKRLIYRPDFLGGAKLSDSGFIFPSFTFFGRLGLNPTQTLNATLFLIQILYAFFGSRTADDLTRAWSDPLRSYEKSWPTRLCVIWLTGFAPVIAWRLSYGHFNLLLGGFAFSVAACWLAAARTERFSFTLFTVSVVALLNCFPTVGQQITLYGVVFGGPILVGLAWPIFDPAKWNRIPSREQKRRIRWAVLFSLLLIGCVGLSMPALSRLFGFALGPDSSRSLSGQSLIYSFSTQGGNDWLSSITWGLQLIPSKRHFSYWHDNNFPFGPLLLLLFLLPWKRAKPLALGMAVSALLAIMFGRDLEPVASLLPKLVPPLNAFRCPGRAILPLILLLPAIAVAGLQASHRDLKNYWAPSSLATGATASALIWFSPPLAREILLWSLALLFIFPLSRRFRWAGTATSFALLALAIGSLAAFKERLLPFTAPSYLAEQPKNVRLSILSSAPQLSNPLVRAHLNFSIPEVHANTGYLMGISTLDGYGFTLRRFDQLVAALQNKPYYPGATIYQFKTTDPEFGILKTLYNLRYFIEKNGDAIKTTETGPTYGPAWFGSSLYSVPSWKALADAIRDDQKSKPPSPENRILMLEAEAPRGIQLGSSTQCALSRVEPLEISRGVQQLQFRVTTSANCPLTIAMNYTSDLKITDSQSLRPLPTFPAYGALLGTVIPAGTHAIQIDSVPSEAMWPTAAWALGLILVAIAAGLGYDLAKSKHAGSSVAAVPPSKRHRDRPPSLTATR